MSLPRPTVSRLRRSVISHGKPRLPSYRQTKLPAGANRILFVKNLNYNITGDDMYELFGRYGSIRQIRLGAEPSTKGTAYVVYDDVTDVRRFVTSPCLQHKLTCIRVKG